MSRAAERTDTRSKEYHDARFVNAIEYFSWQVCYFAGSLETFTRLPLSPNYPELM